MKKVRDPDAIRRAMKARDLTFREMGLLCECSPGTIQFAIDGMAINAALARRIARVLRGRLDDLFAVAVSSSEQHNDKSGAVA